MSKRNEQRIMNVTAELRTTQSSEESQPVIDGYFAVFNQETELFSGVREVIDPDAFTRTLSEGSDVRALINHDTTQVLGRTKSGTLKLETDDHGLHGTIHVNKNDQDAMNLYARIARGDVDQCSFGFVIRDEEATKYDDGSVLYRVKDVDLFEVSCCTFPAYPATAIEARKAQSEENRVRTREQWKNQMKEKLHGTKTNSGNEKKE